MDSKHIKVYKIQQVEKLKKYHHIQGFACFSLHRHTTQFHHISLYITPHAPSCDISELPSRGYCLQFKAAGKNEKVDTSHVPVIFDVIKQKWVRTRKYCF